MTIDKEVELNLLIMSIVLAILLLLWVLAVRGRTGHEKLTELRGWAYAHRGLYGDGIPENSLAAFHKAKEAGYGIELDVHLLSDGALAVIHDSKLERTTGKKGRVEDLTADQLENYRLEKTDETIPLFSQVLELYNGEAPLIVELKSAGKNIDELCGKTCEMLDGYTGLYCMESFDPRCIRWLRKNRPDIIRGQLTENYFVSDTSTLPAILKFILRNQLLNFLTLPDFVAYRFSDRKTFSNTLVRKFWGVQGVTWTLKTQEEYDIATKEGWIPIFESFRP